MNWVFKILQHNEQFTIGTDKVIFRFSQKRNFSGEKGDNVIFLTREKEQWLFSYYGTIESIEVANEGLSNDSQKQFSIEINNIKSIKEPYSLDDFSYTLTKIYKWYNQPIRHFRGNYGKLDKQGYEAIIHSQIFISRTAFGKTLNAMNKEHRISFLQTLLQDNPALYSQGNNYVELFSMLKDYIETYIYTDIYMMEEIGKLLHEISAEEAKDLSFADPEESEKKDNRLTKESNNYNIMGQVNICNDFRKRSEQRTLENLYIEIQNVSEDEINFSKLFTNHSLPIFLN